MAQPYVHLSGKVQDRSDRLDRLLLLQLLVWLAEDPVYDQ